MAYPGPDLDRRLPAITSLLGGALDVGIAPPVGEEAFFALVEAILDADPTGWVNAAGEPTGLAEFCHLAHRDQQLIIAGEAWLHDNGAEIRARARQQRKLSRPRPRAVRLAPARSR